MSSIKNLPVLGNVSLPVHIMHYSNKEDAKKFFQSGFAFFAIADDQADVEGPNGEKIGELGSCMGGHYQVHVNADDESVHVIINVEDIWKQICDLLDTDDVKIKFEGIEKIYNEYWPKYQAAQAEKKTKKAKLKEIEDMQKEAENEAARERMRIAMKTTVEEPEQEIEKEPEVIPGVKYGDVEILNNNGWDLDKEIPSQDWVIEESNIKITPDYGCGVRTKYKDETYTFKHNPRRKPTVTLEISTWKGMSAGAIHYYGKLGVKLPEMEKDNEPGHTIGLYGHGTIPMFKNDDIELTQVIEEWEIKKYPQNYQYCRAGQRHRGFYAVAGVERRGREVFDKIFGEGWKLKIDKRF